MKRDAQSCNCVFLLSVGGPFTLVAGRFLRRHLVATVRQIISSTCRKKSRLYRSCWYITIYPKHTPGSNTPNYAQCHLQQHFSPRQHAQCCLQQHFSPPQQPIQHVLDATVNIIKGENTSVVANQYRTSTTSKCNPIQYAKNAFREYRLDRIARVRLYTIFSSGLRFRYTRADSCLSAETMRLPFHGKPQMESWILRMRYDIVPYQYLRQVELPH